MQWDNTETPSFAGSPRSDGSAAVVETMELKDRDGNVVATFTKQADGSFVFAPQGSVEATISSGEVGITETYDGASSHQPIWADLELDPEAGSDEGTNPKFLAAVMGNVLGADLTHDSNYIAGVIGALAITGTKGSDYPVAGLMGVLFDGVQADSIVLADLDGDDGGSPTNARAAFGVKVNNNNPSSGCEFGLSLKDTGNSNYTGGGNDFEPSKADFECSNGLWIVPMRTAVTANVTTTDAPEGSLGFTSHATGKGKLFMSDGAKWQFAVVA